MPGNTVMLIIPENIYSMLPESQNPMVTNSLDNENTPMEAAFNSGPHTQSTVVKLFRGHTYHKAFIWI